MLRADGVLPDFEATGGQPGAAFDYIHRADSDWDIYFVSNQQNRTERADVPFALTARQPEIWDPVSGQRRDAVEFRLEPGRTIVPLEFAPRQSWFVVFRKPVEPNRAGGRNFPACPVAATLEGPWHVAFDPQWGGPASVAFDRLVDWTTRPEPGMKYYSGKATYTQRFDLPPSCPAGWSDDLSRLGSGEEPGGRATQWSEPGRRVDGTLAGRYDECVQARDNQLEVDVVNLWPNRLIGDAALPLEQRLTVTNVKKFTPDSPLLASGLLGPVTIQAESRE